MRISIIENRGKQNEKEVILDVGTVEKRKTNRGIDCLYVDGMIFETGDGTDITFQFMLEHGYLDLTGYKYYESGI